MAELPRMMGTERHRRARLARAEAEARIHVALALAIGIACGVLTMRAVVTPVFARVGRVTRMFVGLVMPAVPLGQRIPQDADRNRHRPGKRRAAEAE